MARSWTGLVLALLLGAAAACGDDDKASTVASCNVPVADFCMDINGILPGDEAGCTGSGGIWINNAACPTVDLIGTCTIVNPNAAQTIAVRFYAPTWNDTNAASTCASFTPPGTYTP